MLKGLKSAIKWIVAIALICAVMIGLASINGLQVNRTVISVDGSKVTQAEYEYYLEMAKQQVLQEQGIADEEAAKKFLKEGKVGDKSAKDYIREMAIDEVVKAEAIVALAKEAGVELTDDERSAARSTEGMEEYLEQMGVDKETWRTVSEKASLANKYYSHITESQPEAFAVSEEDINKGIDENYALVQHVLIKNAPDANEDGTLPETEGYAEEAKKRAEDILAKALAGENFYTLVTTYGEDPGMDTNPDGYLIDKNGNTLDGSQMMTEFTDGAFAVAPGEVNAQLIETSYGYHIIKRCVIAEDILDAADLAAKEAEEAAAEAAGEEVAAEAATEELSTYQTIKQSVENMLKSEKFDAFVKEKMADMKIDKKDKVLNKAKIEF